jgi:hypothetical protein
LPVPEGWEEKDLEENPNSRRIPNDESADFRWETWRTSADETESGSRSRQRSFFPDSHLRQGANYSLGDSLRLVLGP